MKPTLEEIVENLTWELGSWKTLSLKVREDYDTSQGRPGGRINHEYLETALGQRYYRSEFTNARGNTSHERVSCDGQRCWNFSIGPDGRVAQVVIARSVVREHNTGFTIRPKPLAMMYAGMTPLNEAIRTAEPSGEDQVLGRTCDLYRISGVKVGPTSVDIVYYLDRETSVPLRVVFLRGPESSLSSPHTLWEADSFDQVGSYHVPLRSHFIAYGPPDESGTPKEAVRQNITVEAIDYDKEIDARLFQPEIEPGVAILDTIAPTATRQPPLTAAVGTPQPGALGVEAEAPRSWMAYGPWAAAGLGVGAILVGLVLWVRRSMT